MSAAQQAKARRRQARNGFKHLAERQRPKYKVRDALASARRLQQQIETERRIKMKLGKKAG